MIQHQPDAPMPPKADPNPSRPVESSSEGGASTAGTEVLGRFRAWCAVDRRRSPRQAPTAPGVRVWVGWWDGAHFAIERGALSDLGRGGARVLLKEGRRLAAGQTVWACVGSPEPVDSVEARVLEDCPVSGSGRVVRLRFHAPCPGGFFRAAGLGTEVSGVAGGPAAS